MFINLRRSSSATMRLFVLILVIFSSLFCLNHDHRVTAEHDHSGGGGSTAAAVKRNEREEIVQSEYGEISRVRLSDGNQSYQIQFFTLEPNSLLLPVLLHEDMLFYVQTGSGVISYLDIDENEKESRELRRGDVHRLRSGSIFFLQSDLEDPERQKLRLLAIFGNSGPDFIGAAFEPYSSIRDVVLGFDKKVLQQIFKVPEEVIEEITREPKPAAIIQATQKKEKTLWEMEQKYLTNILGGNLFHYSNKDKKSKLYNIYSDKPDFQNCNGWSTTVNRKKYSPLRHSQFTIFMVNLTTGSMMGPHWNPRATEIAVVLQGKGMVRVVCSSGFADKECRSNRINVEQGDAFVVPRYHPMAHMAFNNETFVFVGFSTSTRKNHPQFLAGQASVLRTLDKGIVARSFGVGDEMIDRLLVNQGESVILKCVSCAEEEWRMMVEERERQEEEARREEEEKRRKEEEEARKREEQEREEREREERKKQEEEEKEEREREEAAGREEEEREAEERRRREEEEAKKREEQAERQREQKEKEAREREEAEQREREEQEAEERRRRQEEEEAKKREEEAEQKREQEETEAREREEAEEKRRKQEEEEAERQREQKEKEAREREEAARREREEQEAEERRRRQEEEEAKKREEEAAQQREQEEREAREREEQAAEEKQRKQEEKEAEEAVEEKHEAREREEAAQREREQQEAEERQQRQEEKHEKAAQQHEQEETEAREREEAAQREREQQEAEERQQRQEAEEAKKHEKEASRQHEKEQKEAQEREEKEAQRRESEQRAHQREAKAKSEEEAARHEEEEAPERLLLI